MKNDNFFFFGGRWREQSPFCISAAIIFFSFFFSLFLFPVDLPVFQYIGCAQFRSKIKIYFCPLHKYQFGQTLIDIPIAACLVAINTSKFWQTDLQTRPTHCPASFLVTDCKKRLHFENAFWVIG